MFAVRLSRLYNTCDRVIVRNLRSRRLAIPNPGLQNRLDAYKEDNIKIEEDDAEEYVEQSASDFSKVDNIYNEHMKETQAKKVELRHHIVKEKYFKENMPNLLTWSEKEQIRHLATSDPDEWIPEKIAESFPVTVPIVKKLLKYPWKPASVQRIARHDDSAMRNWRALKEGNLDIPEELQQRFLKFTDRTIPPLKKESIKIEITREEDLGEFERIIHKCASKGPTHSHADEQSSKENSNRNDDEIVKKDTKRVTLDELAEKVKQRLEKGNEINTSDTLMLHMVNSEPEVATKGPIKEVELFHEEDEGKLVTEFKKEQAESIMNYPERIRIPKKAYKKGATYKVNDCYYDHDGRFLYRVLGMTNNEV